MVPSTVAEDALIGKGQFRVLSPGGTDLCGALFLGERCADQAAVHIKLLDPDLYPDDATWQRLFTEMELCTQLTHGNLLRAHGVFLEGERAYLVQDAPSGQSLRQLLEKKKSQGQPMSVKGAHNVLSQLCNLLSYAHGAFPHGALCPDNIDVDIYTGQVRVADLAAGRFVPPARLGRLLPAAAACLAPERMGGAPASVAADVYAAGAILFECLTLRPAPPDLASADPDLSRVLRIVPPPLLQVVRRCLAADPAARYQTPQRLKEALAEAIDNPKNTSSQPILAASAHRSGPPVDAPSGPKVSEQMPALVNAPVSASAPHARPAGISISLPPQPPNTPKEPMADQEPKGPPGPPPNTSLPRPARPSAPPPILGSAAPPLVSSSQPALPASNLAAVTGVDEDHERWLVQKEDKMDYGPFPLREVRSQIEKGTIHADHFIKDMDSGDRRRVREHPLLSDMAREWEARHAQSAMEQRDRAEQAQHRASVQKWLAAFVIALVVIGAPAVYFLILKKPKEVVKIVKEQSGDDFWKGIQVSMNVDPPVKKAKKPGTGKRHGPKNGPFDETTNMGDASEEGGDETLTGEQVQRVMNQNFRLLGGCLKEAAQANPGVKKFDLDFLIKGTGKVSAVKVNGDAGSAAASCVFQKMQAVDFPRFNGAKTHAAFSLALK